MIHYIEKVTEHSAVKAVVAVIIWALTAMFGQYKPMYGVILSLYLLDFVLGYSRAWLDPNVRPSSKRLRAGLLKLLCYMVLLFVGYQLSLTHVSVLILIQTTAETTIALTEAKSILENLRDLGELRGTKFPIVDNILQIIEGKMPK